MKKQEAEELMAFLRAAFPRMELETQILYSRLLEREHDADLVSRAILKGVSEWKYPPSFSELKDYIRLERRLAEPEHDIFNERMVSTREMPVWVKRWVCARFLYSRFGRERDMRPFREQSAFSESDDFMPEDEWATEAAAVSTGEAWAALRSGTGVA
jgi:hypothetical protein